MNENLSKSIEALEKTLTESSNLFDNIKEEFDKVKSAQTETNKKLTELNESVKNTLNEANKKFSKSLSDFKSNSENLIKDNETKFETSEKNLRQLNNKFQNEVNKLIADVQKKTSKIIEYGGGISKIEKDVNNFLNKIETRWNQNEKSVKQILERLQDDSINKTLNKLSQQIQEQSEKISHLEKYSHTHKIGGVKI